MGHGQDVWRFLACFFVTFSSFASWSVPQSSTGQIDHIYIIYMYIYRSSCSIALLIPQVSQILLKLVAINALKILCWEWCKKSISKVLFRLLGSTVGHLWEKDVTGCSAPRMAMVFPPMLFVRVRAARGWNVRVVSRQNPMSPWKKSWNIMKYSNYCRHLFCFFLPICSLYVSTVSKQEKIYVDIA